MAATKFMFGTDFREGSRKAAGEADIAAARAEGFHAGQEQAHREAQGQLVGLTGQLARSAERLFAQEAARTAAIEEHAAHVAIATAKALAGAALAEKPLAALEGAVREALNHARTARRHARLLAAMPAPEQEPDHAEEVLDRLDRDRQLGAIRDAMAKLNAQERSIIDLCLVEGLPMATVAAVLDIPVGTVKSKLHRAREKIRRQVPAHPALGEFTARLDGAQP